MGGFSVTPRPPLPLRERPGTHCTGGWVGTRASLDRCRKFCPPPGFDPQTVQPVESRYTDWAIAAPLLCSGKGTAVPLQAWSGPEGSRKLTVPDFMTMAQDVGKVVSLTHRPPLPPGNTPGTHFCTRLSRPQGHSATGRIMSLKNSNDTIGNRTCDRPVCSVVP
jgi:hypothetical protein